MAEWYWAEHVLRLLTAMLRAWEPLPDGSAVDGGPLDWETSIGWDDGYSRARLTLVVEKYPQTHLLRVYLGTSSTPFGGPGPDIPAYDDPAPDRPPRVNRAEFTRHMAVYLLERCEGDPASLRTEPNGAWSFTRPRPMG
jgi:hypothetical protein